MADSTSVPASPRPSATASASAEPSAQPSATSSPTAAPPSSTAPPAPAPAAPVANAALTSAVAQAPGAVSVSVTDLTTGQSLSYGAPGHGFATASIVKVDILATLLLQAQDGGTSLTADQQGLASAMIENSDNDSATALWNDIGQDGGLNAANRRFGLTATTGGTDGYWGLTSTTADDQVRLLRQVFTGDSLLSAASRSYLQGLLGQVESDQRWGVSAAASGGDYAVKNGWLPRSDTGLWVINSIGTVQRNGHQLLIAAVSDGNPTESGGISLVQAVAQAAAGSLDGG
ncbi:serine hydrolase [Kitasatospora viridis]|uniref:Beta-lactamase class A n=1 Tax=Kitasatospora viridis TaxID=281105 RepID=A0A561TSS6_9ACTN|nr:serine hydrolase [Kitasatospora viridis]TWF90158.1 beta-lactamase class A [Kitasatospora viridis]